LELGGQFRLTLPAGLYELVAEVSDAKGKKAARASAPFSVEPAAEKALRPGAP
jgi:hypothetical protein